MRKTLLVGLAVLLWAGLALPVEAATADFQCNCQSGVPTFCVCDAGRQSSFGPGTSCGSASITQYFWDFGDGTSFFTSNAFVSHTYSQSHCADDFIDLAVFCSDGSSATQSHCYCSTVGINGCIRPGAGWTP